MDGWVTEEYEWREIRVWAGPVHPGELGNGPIHSSKSPHRTERQCSDAEIQRFGPQTKTSCLEFHLAVLGLSIRQTWTVWAGSFRPSHAAQAGQRESQPGLPGPTLHQGLWRSHGSTVVWSCHRESRAGQEGIVHRTKCQQIKHFPPTGETSVTWFYHPVEQRARM
jgi:hypothetical protein